MFVMKGLEPARTPYGKPRVIADHVVQPGEIIKFYHTRKNLQVGQNVTISPPGYDMPGVIVGTEADNARFQHAQICGKPERNVGEGFYFVRIMEIPD